MMREVKERQVAAKREGDTSFLLLLPSIPLFSFFLQPLS